jgi:AcrR family transcriptional regulator
MARPADPNAKEALVAAARAEFARRGLRGARIEDITAACGLSKGAFYLHFESKEALFGELVRAFIETIAGLQEKRERAMQQFIEKHGELTERDVELRTPRYQELIELDTRSDLDTLEAMWTYRDVVGVLVRGSQGTAFEGTIWELADGEVNRVRESFERYQGHGVCRPDIPGELFGSLIVGTYLLLAVRMSRLQEKPDLREWARSLHTLVHEGSQPSAQTNFENVKSPARSKP